jgi:hypothetical protein
MHTPRPAFPHRHNRDGSYDSICVKCFATIATERIEEMLAESEQKHVCRSNPMLDTKHWSRLAENGALAPKL